MRVGDTQTWPALRYFAADSDLGRRVDVGVVENDRRRMAAEFHRRALHVHAGERRQVACRPAVEPVNEILRMTGCGIRYSEISAGMP